MTFDLIWSFSKIVLVQTAVLVAISRKPIGSNPVLQYQHPARSQHCVGKLTLFNPFLLHVPCPPPPQLGLILETITVYQRARL